MIPLVIDNSVVVVAGADVSGPVVEVVAAPAAIAGGDRGAVVPFVVVDAGLAGPRLAVQGGLQLRHDFGDLVFVRGAASAGGFVVGAHEVGAGVVADLGVDVGFVLGPVDLVVGPVVGAAASVADARVSPGAHVGAVIDVVDLRAGHVECVVDAAGGYDLGGVYGHAADGAVDAGFVVGVRLSL